MTEASRFQILKEIKKELTKAVEIIKNIND